VKKDNINLAALIISFGSFLVGCLMLVAKMIELAMK